MIFFYPAPHALKPISSSPCVKGQGYATVITAFQVYHWLVVIYTMYVYIIF